MTSVLSLFAALAGKIAEALVALPAPVQIAAIAVVLLLATLFDSM